MGIEYVLQQLGLRRIPGFDLPPGLVPFYGEPGTDTEGTQSFSVPNGSLLDQRLSFRPGSVVIDNNTSAYLNVPDATKDGVGRWVPPGYPAALPLLGSVSRARINWSAPPNKVQPLVVPTEVAQVVFAASQTPIGLGVASPQSAQGRATAFPSLSRAAGTYTFIPPNLLGIKGMIVFLAVTGGTGTATLSIRDSDTTLVGGTTATWVTSLAIANPGGVELLAYPGIPATANASANTVLGQTPSIVVVVATAATTFQVDYDLLA